jgi:uncharacterized repeat protein (TIGR01451 family)
MPTPPNRLAKFRPSGARLSPAAALLLLAALSLSQTLTPEGSAESRREPARAADGARLAEAYGRLPLRFEANRGQSGAAVKFIARGGGYTLFLAESGAVLRLRAAGEGQRYDTLRLAPDGARRPAKVEGLEELRGRSNYLVGADARAWVRDVPAFARVRYESVYEGIDAVYYGRQGRLEYDFQVAPGADPSRIRLRFEGARGLRVDEGGDLVISTRGGDVRQQRPVAYQESGGARREVKAGYKVDARGRLSFELGAYDRALPLVIDPVLLYSSYLGGSGSDAGAAVAVDASGSAYVAGTTASTDFPNPGSFQTSNGNFNDAFVLKLSADGKSLVYATYLGGNGGDSGYAVAVDAAGNAYVGGATSSTNFPTTPGSFQPARESLTDAFLTKLNPTGTALVYSTYVGGKGSEEASSVAVDAAGAAYVAGRTDSPNFTNVPSVVRAGSPVYKSADGAASWGASGAGLTASTVNDLAAPSGAAVYASSNQGVFRSADGGATWQLGGQANPATAPFVTRAVVADPSNPSVVYAGAFDGRGVYKSTDGGVTFAVKNGGAVQFVNTLAIDPSSPSTLYAATNSIYRTTDGGETWAQVAGLNTGFNASVNKLAVDPSNSAVVYAGTTNGVYKTTNGGTTWLPTNGGGPQGFSFRVQTLAIDPSNTSTLYAAGSVLFSNGVYKTTNGGATWTNSSAGLSVNIDGQPSTPTVNALLVDPALPSTVYAATAGFGVFKSSDGGANWSPSNSGLANRTVLALAARPGSPAALLAGAAAGADAFVLKLNPAGSAAEYLRLLGGSEGEDARAVALGPGGAAYVTGTTASPDFPTSNARQSALAGQSDAYVVKLDPAGNTVYSTYLGGSSYDSGGGVAVGADGAAYVTGSTGSNDFPTANALKSGLGPNDFQDAFVTKLSPDGQALVYSTYLGGGTGSEAGASIAVDAGGRVHVVGQTTSQDFPVVGASSPLAGFSDAFVTRLNAGGSALLFSTCFGGSNGTATFETEQANAVALDGAGGVYVVGTTTATNLPVVNAARATFGGGNTDAFVAKFGPGIDLAVTLTDSPDPVALGSDLTYAVRVKNNGDLDATGVKLNDALPAGATLVSAASDRGSCSGAATVVCDIGTLAGGEEANVTVKVKPPATRTINNAVSATLNEADANPSNNSAATETTVDFTDLAVTKRALFGGVAPGAKVVFLLTVTNKSGAAAGNVTVSDALPAGLTFASCDSPRGACGGTGNSRTVTFPTLAVGATEGASIAATVDASAAPGAVINNTATVSSNFNDPDTSDNTASASVTVAGAGAGARANGKVVLAAGDGIYTVNADGTGRTRVHATPPNASEYDPVWSPGGTQILYRRNVTPAGFPAAPFEFYVMDADGSNDRRVAAGNVESRATWSPDGSHVAYARVDPFTNTSDLFAVATDGTGETRIAHDLGFVRMFDWSPDGSRFVYQKNNANVFVMDADGSNRRQLTFTEQTADGNTVDEDPLWTFDGARVTFTRRNNVAAYVHVVKADGTGLRRLLNEYAVRGQLSPDGTKLAYEGGPDGAAVTNVDGSTYLYTLGPGRDPSWQSLPNANPTPTPPPAETYSISGHVATPSPFGGYVPVRLSGTRAATVSTDSAGNYAFVNLPRGGNYTVTPLPAAGEISAVFTPASRTVSDLQADVTGFDFTKSTVPHVVGGRVMDAAGNGLAGVRVTDTPGNNFFGATTDAQGRYSINIFQSSEFLPLQPFSNALTFDPFRAVLRRPTGDVTLNFVGAPSAGVRALQGRVIDTSGLGVAGVTVTLGGARGAVVKTDEGGGYVFYNLPAGQPYTVTPASADGLAFTPAQKSYPSLGDADTGFETFVANAALPTAQFAAAGATVTEGARFVELTLTRGPDPRLAAYVDFETSDLTASERSDYTAASGRVYFAPGETSQRLRVLVTDDGLLEGERAFKVTLTGGRNLFVGAAKEAVVRITDDDAAASQSNPLDASEFFVRQHYADFLNREPDADGLAFWTNEIESCGADAQCREVKRINVSAAFFLSIEFQQTGYLVYRLHQAAFNTGERLRLRAFLKDTREIGRGVVVGAPGWEELLEANKRAFIEEFVLRPEFRLAYPLTLPPALFVDTLNANTGGSLDAAERDALVAGLTSGSTTRAQALRSVAENAEFSRRQSDRAFVLMQYFGYLRRGPAEPPDSDSAGWRFWLSKLEQFHGNYIEAEMVKAFISSDEYRKRFGQ